MSAFLILNQMKNMKHSKWIMCNPKHLQQEKGVICCHSVFSSVKIIIISYWGGIAHPCSQEFESMSMIKPQPFTILTEVNLSVNDKVTIHPVITEGPRILIKGLQETSRTICDIHKNYFLIQKVITNKPQEHLRPKIAQSRHATVRGWPLPL